MIPSSKLERLKEGLIKNCKECGGESCRKCLSQGARFQKYSEAGIPLDYWQKSWADFEGDENFKVLISGYLKDITKVFDTGQSLAFIGNLGVGKTYASSAILKMAIVNGFSAYHISMTDVVSLVLSSNSDSAGLIERLKNVDFLCLDEFDGRWIANSDKSQMIFGSFMENILRARFQNQMPTILCSNAADIDKVLSDDFSRTFSSLRSNYMKVITVAGKDYRKTRKNNGK